MVGRRHGSAGAHVTLEGCPRQGKLLVKLPLGNARLSELRCGAEMASDASADTVASGGWNLRFFRYSPDRVAQRVWQDRQAGGGDHEQEFNPRPPSAAFSGASTAGCGVIGRPENCFVVRLHGSGSANTGWRWINLACRTSDAHILCINDQLKRRHLLFDCGTKIT